MRPVLTAAEMRSADRHAIDEIGLPGAVLMENAGTAVAREIESRFPSARRVVVVCGKGNNGGDGFVAARRLRSIATVHLVGRAADVAGDAAVHLGALQRLGGTVRELEDEASWAALREDLDRADVVVDALLGTGLDRAPEGPAARAIDALRSAWDAGRPVAAVDLPSGVSSDTGSIPGRAVRATFTVTFAALKHGHVLAPACDRCGEVVVADIGIPIDAGSARLGLLECPDAALAFPRRSAAAHKGDFGHVLVVAGSTGKTGAAVLAATGALRAGAGLVTVAVPAPSQPVVAAGRAEVMTEALPVDGDGSLGTAALARALRLAEGRDAVVVGPGLGVAGGTPSFVRELVARCPVAVLVDADGLNALGTDRDALRARAGTTVLTPHPGEMARLLGSSVAEVQADRLAAARALAAQAGAHVALKGQRTLVVEPGGRAAVCPTGNPGMASGGTGDVLAGVIGALLARGHGPWRSTTAGVFVHGLAGDRAAARFGEDSLVAGDLIEALPEAILEVGRRACASA